MPIDDLNNLPSGTSIFVDTIIFDLHFKSKSVSCSALMRRIALGDVKAYVNTQVLADFLHKSMLAEAFAKGFITSPSHQKLKNRFANHPAAAASLTDCQQNLNDVLSFGVKVLNIARKTIVNSVTERQTYSLMTNDSIHLYTMLNHRLAITNLVTQDADFGNIPVINVWQPQDVIT